ncbi:nucleoside-diphosphate sugar epimerase/dehydratase [Geothrix sp. SG200]|uniref:polysaccharide biosynthesis protein n=1 Tax=Geothrix sp. SG200 TaxID=2922865 RepID=UPI0024354D77|nr:nucleoside-diphosphate sugar epimerase/dehydratase [Geothrix sp. SG200]
MPTNRTLRRHPLLRKAVKLTLDLLLAGLAWAASERFLSVGSPIAWHIYAWVGLCGVVNLGFRLTRQQYRYIGFRDTLQLVAASLTLCLTALVLGHLTPDLEGALSFDTLVTASLATAVTWALARTFVRARYEGLLREKAPDARQRTLIVGAGRAGLLVAQEIQRHPELGSQVIGYVDDAFDKQGILLQGVPVMGPSRLLRTLVADHHITQVVLAIPSASGATIRRLREAAQATGVRIKTVPGISDLLGPRTWKPELRDVSIEDLLRREPIQLDQSALGSILEDATVLITGAGGSIGSELARQVAAFRPARLILLGRGENSLWEIERDLRALFPNQALSLELCDIRHTNRLRHVFERWRPQVVLHAAAHKHVPYLEAHPEEAVNNNIFGTERVLDAALAVGVHTFVNISTDKSVNPTNVLGASKHIAEGLVLRAARRAPAGAHYVSVRFGNVLGSRGSVIPIFRQQIQAGGPLTVTHPDMIRYFMTIPEASQLALQAGILGDTGKVYVLDMGEPVRIVDLATDMARLSGLVPGRDIEVKFTGIRPGEKLFEELFSAQEESRTDVHPKVLDAHLQAPEDALFEQGLDGLRLAMEEDEGRRQAQMLRWLRRLVPTYTPSALGLGRFAAENRDRRHSGANPVYLPDGA